VSPVLRLTSAIFLALILVFLILLIRKGRIKPKYSLIWIFVSLVLIFLDIFPDVLQFLATLFGFKLASNFFLTGVIFLLICLSIHLSIVLSRTEDRLRDLTENFAILKNEVEELKSHGESGPETEDRSR
jgi:hypothetical protein